MAKNTDRRTFLLQALAAGTVGALVGGEGEALVKSTNDGRIPDINDEIARHQKANHAFDEALGGLSHGKQTTLRAEIDKQRKELDSEREHGNMPTTWSNNSPAVAVGVVSTALAAAAVKEGKKLFSRRTAIASGLVVAATTGSLIGQDIEGHESDAAVAKQNATIAGLEEKLRAAKIETDARSKAADVRDKGFHHVLTGSEREHLHGAIDNALHPPSPTPSPSQSTSPKPHAMQAPGSASQQQQIDAATAQLPKGGLTDVTGTSPGAPITGKAPAGAQKGGSAIA